MFLGFASLLAWFLTGEQLCISRDPGLYNAAVVVGATFAGALVICAAVPPLRQKMKCGPALSIGTAGGVGCGIVYAIAVGTGAPETLRVLPFCLQSLCAIPHIAAWGDLLGHKLCIRTLGLVATAGIAAALIALVTSVAPSWLAFVLLAVLPACSGACAFLLQGTKGAASNVIAAPNPSTAGQPDETSGQAEAPAPAHDAHLALRDAEGARNRALLILLTLLCAASFAVSLFDGLATSPYIANSTTVGAVSTGIFVLVAALAIAAGAWLFKRCQQEHGDEEAIEPPRTRRARTLLTLVHALSAAALVLLVAGALLLSLGLPGTMTSAIGMTMAARNLLLLLCWAAFPQVRQEPDGKPGEHVILLALFSGIPYAQYLGAWIAKTAQLTFYGLVNASSALIAFIAVLAIVYTALRIQWAGTGDADEDVTRKDSEKAQTSPEERRELSIEEIHEALRAHWLSLMEPYHLTEREREVVLLLIDGQTMGGIAEQLFITERTVKFHCRNAYAKLGVHSKKELMQMFSGL